MGHLQNSDGSHSIFVEESMKRYALAQLAGDVVPPYTPPRYSGLEHPFAYGNPDPVNKQTAPVGTPVGCEGTLEFGLKSATSSVDLTNGGFVEWEYDFGGASNYWFWHCITISGCTTGLDVTDHNWNQTFNLPLDLDSGPNGEPGLLVWSFQNPLKQNVIKASFSSGSTTGSKSLFQPTVGLPWFFRMEVPAADFVNLDGLTMHAAAMFFVDSSPQPLFIGTTNAMATTLDA